MGQPNRLPQTNIVPFPPARAENERSRPEQSKGAASRPKSGAAFDDVLPRAEATSPSQDLFEQLKSPLIVLSSGLRLLAAAIVLLAVVPTLGAVAIFRLGPVDASPSAIAASNHGGATREVVITLPFISTRTVLRATPGKSASFPIVLDGTDPLEGLGTIAISRLPAGSTFSAGVPQGETAWELKPREIDNLRLVLPEAARGELPFVIQLLAPDGHVISDDATIVDVNAVPEVPVRRVKTETIRAEVWDQAGQTPEAMDTEAEITNQGGTLQPDPVPLPSGRPHE